MINQWERTSQQHNKITMYFENKWARFVMATLLGEVDYADDRMRKEIDCLLSTMSLLGNLAFKHCGMVQHAPDSTAHDALVEWVNYDQVPMHFRALAPRRRHLQPIAPSTSSSPSFMLLMCPTLQAAQSSTLQAAPEHAVDVSNPVCVDPMTGFFVESDDEAASHEAVHSSDDDSAPLVKKSKKQTSSDWGP
jgi:hypothetical protein